MGRGVVGPHRLELWADVPTELLLDETGPSAPTPTPASRSPMASCSARKALSPAGSMHIWGCWAGVIQGVVVWSGARVKAKTDLLSVSNECSHSCTETVGGQAAGREVRRRLRMVVGVLQLMLDVAGPG